MPFRIDQAFLCCAARQITGLLVDKTDESRIRELLDSPGTTVHFGITNHNERAFEEKLKTIGGEQVKLLFEWGNYTTITEPDPAKPGHIKYVMDEQGRFKKQPLRLWALIPKGAYDAVSHPFLELAVPNILAKKPVKIDENWPIVKKKTAKKVLAKKNVVKRAAKKPVERKDNAR